MRHTVLLTAICGAAVTFGVAVMPAQADLLRELRSGVWVGGAYSLEGAQKFNACIVTVNYNSGINVGIIIDRDFHWYLGFSNPQWNLQTGQDISISMTFDSGAPWSGKVIAHLGSA